MKTLIASTALLISAVLSAPAAATDAPIGNLPQASKVKVDDFRRQVDALYRMKEKAFADEDANKIVEHFYSADAITFGPEGKPTIGREGFREDYRNVVKIANVRIEPVYTHVGADAAWEWANFRATPKDSSQKPFTFIMLFVFAKKDGKWVSGGDAYSLGEFPSAK